MNCAACDTVLCEGKCTPKTTFGAKWPWPTAEEMNKAKREFLTEQRGKKLFIGSGEDVPFEYEKVEYHE